MFSEEGCLFLHLYAPLYIEKEVATKIEIVEIDDMDFPKDEVQSDEMDININAMEIDE